LLRLPSQISSPCSGNGIIYEFGHEHFSENRGKAGIQSTGKALMIAIPFAAMIGGIATPAGSSINILALYMLEKYAHLKITFLDWMVFGLPITIVMVPLSSLVLVKLFKPEPLTGILKGNNERSLADCQVAAAQESNGAVDLSSLLNMPDTQQGFSMMEKKVLVIVSLMMAFWIASTWVPAINITMVAVVGLIVFFLPGIDVLT
jgi:sodium-dependent dicarboxylate transporter 2/3/5